MKHIQVIDSHTGGEPTRLVIDGFPNLGDGSMAQRQHILATQHDAWRKAVMLEPRGNDVLVGALLCAPVSPDAVAGVIFFNNAGYLGMCGHGTIGLVASLAYLGKIKPGVHTIETSVGSVTATLHADGSVSVRNIPAYRHAQRVAVDVPGYGTVFGDVAWGGNWFFLIDEHGLTISSQQIPALTAYCAAVKDALAAQGITGADAATIDHIELFASDHESNRVESNRVELNSTAANITRAHSRNFVLCPGNAYDRSPCGTGTSAKIACLAADGLLAPGAIYRQASVIGSQFEASYVIDGTQIIPTIRGQAYMSAHSTLLLDPTDPFVWGIDLNHA